MNLTGPACSLLLVALMTTANADDATTVDVELKDLKLALPATWKAQKNTSQLRLATYEVPAEEGDSEAGELAVYNFAGGGGGVAENLNRWIGQFSSDGRESKLTKGSANGNDYYVADVTGTYNKPVGPPVLRKTEAAEGYAMMAVIVVLKDKGVYYLKLTGQEKTVSAHADALRKSFGGDRESEDPYEI